MIAEQPTRKVVKALRAAGFAPVRSARGSHTVWSCGDGRHTITVPDGHRTISPGVLRKIQRIINECEEES